MGYQRIHYQILDIMCEKLRLWSGAVSMDCYYQKNGDIGILNQNATELSVRINLFYAYQARCNANQILDIQTEMIIEAVKLLKAIQTEYPNSYYEAIAGASLLRRSFEPKGAGLKAVLIPWFNCRGCPYGSDLYLSAICSEKFSALNSEHEMQILNSFFKVNEISCEQGKAATAFHVFGEDLKRLQKLGVSIPMTRELTPTGEALLFPALCERTDALSRGIVLRLFGASRGALCPERMELLLQDAESFGNDCAQYATIVTGHKEQTLRDNLRIAAKLCGGIRDGLDRYSEIPQCGGVYCIN